jgi:hypothetical protein
MQNMVTLVCVWKKHATLDWNSFLQMDVLDYDFLTKIPILQPVQLKFASSLYKPDPKVDIHSEFKLITKELEFRVGGSALHTILTSLASWKQLLGLWTGNKINLNEILAM